MTARPVARLAVALGAAALVGACTNCGGAPAVDHTPPPPVPAPSPPVEVEARESGAELEDAWTFMPFGGYVAPRGPFWAADGAVDVVVHFHAGKYALDDFRAAGLRAVVLHANFGVFSGDYAKPMASPATFQHMVDSTLEHLKHRRETPDLHVRHLVVTAWSAGYGAVGKVLAVPRYRDEIEAVVLLDCPHGSYGGRPRKVPASSIGPFVTYAKQAAEGKKTMVLTHSSIVPADFPSTTETVDALLGAVGAHAVPAQGTRRETMVLRRRADQGSLHVLGFEGTTKEAHIQHLHLVGELLREHVLPKVAADEGAVP